MHKMMNMTKLDSSWLKGVAMLVGACGLVGCVTPEPPAPPPEERLRLGPEPLEREAGE